MRKHILLFFLILFGVFPIATMIQAKADDLVIKADGAVILIITKDNNVLAETTKKDEGKPKEPEKQPAQKPAERHEEPLTPPHSQTTVQVAPPSSNDKKVEVTVTQSTPKPSQSQTQKPTSPPTPPIVKTVDQVVAEGTNGKPVLTISSSRAHELTISQGTTQVSTNLPLTLDTLTHSLSIGTLSGESSPARVSVLPSEVLRDVLDKGYINPNDIGKVKINLTKDARGVMYTVESQKKGKFLGVFNVIAPVQVKLSAQTGTIINTAQLKLFTFLERFIK